MRTKLYTNLFFAAFLLTLAVRIAIADEKTLTERLSESLDQGLKAVGVRIEKNPLILQVLMSVPVARRNNARAHKTCRVGELGGCQGLCRGTINSIYHLERLLNRFLQREVEQMWKGAKNAAPQAWNYAKDKAAAASDIAAVHPSRNC